MMTLLHTDQSRRFLFEDADIRGESAHLDTAYREILAIHQYPPGVARLLGEFLAAAVLLSSNLKFEGKLVLQARSEGEIPLLMAECDDQLRVRGIARGVEQATSDNNEALLRNGQLAITIDPRRGRRYQGIVALQPGSLAHNLDAYFSQSEQLGSRIRLAANGQCAAGILLQQLPPQVTHDEEQRVRQWDEISSLATTVSGTELLQLDDESLLLRLFAGQRVRVFDPAGVTFTCSCSRERTRDALASLGPEELGQLLAEMDCITMDCEFCNTQYRFEHSDLADILGGEAPETIH